MMMAAHMLRGSRSAPNRVFGAHLRSVRRLSTEAPNDTKKSILGRLAIPTAAGFSLIAVLQWHRLTHPTDKERHERPAPAVQRLPGMLTAVERNMATQRQLESLKLIPYRALSRLWGSVNDKELPVWLRAPVYKTWTYLFDCNLEEMQYPLEHYANLSEFFSRPLKPNARQFALRRHELASPVDGRVAAIGCIDVAGAALASDGQGHSKSVPVLEQIKGARYRLDEFLGELPACATPKGVSSDEYKLYHCVLYLAPGDYHHIHSPVNWTIRERRHFAGNLFPVNNMAARLIPSLFVENERVVLNGDWAHGFFSLAAVGATNVGSIKLQHEPKFHSNKSHQDKQLGHCSKKLYATPIKSHCGDELAQFRLGSTVVLVFEAPASFEFSLKPGDKLVAGASIGRFEV